MSAAAARERLAVSAVSRRIAGLEARLGLRLLERGDRGVLSTDAGERLFRRLKEIFDLFDDMAREIEGMRSGSLGRVRLSAHMSATATDLPDLLASFMARHPGNDVELEEMTSLEVMHSVQTGMTDVGLVSGTMSAGELEFIPWRHDELVVLVPRGHRIASEQATTLGDLFGESFIGMQRDSALIALYRHQAQVQGRSLRERAHATSFESVRKLVAAGLGIAIVPRSAATATNEADKVALVELDERWAKRPLMICVRSIDRVPPAARFLVEHLLAAGSPREG